MKIAVIGGGPAGLYAAMLIKKRQPSWSLDVYEQNPEGATFGFGVVLADTGLNRLRAADAASHDRLVAAMVFNDCQAIVHQRTPVVLKRPKGGGAITRIELLKILGEAARDAGVVVHAATRIDHPDKFADADLIIGADGVNSVVRSGLESAFGTTRSTLNNHFVWYGTDRAFDNPALVFRRERGGAFVAHYYPYTTSHSTFVAECDHATWQALDMEAMSNEAREALVLDVFAEELTGHTLITSGSSWRQFPVIRNREWVAGKHVLIGDAHMSAHFSIGSGTRIAMEDSIALADALTETSIPVAERLARFSARRGAEKARLIGASERSYLWYEEIDEWIKRYTPHQFIYAFMTRTGRVDNDRLAQQFPELFAELRQHAVI